MSLPSFLVIGAQKSGTTSLYDHLATSSSFFLPEDKEPDILHQGDDDTVRQLYAAHFRGASEDQLKGDASTLYTMVPWFEDVSGRAARILGTDLKLVMILRDPVERIESQLRHDYFTGRIDASDLDTVVFDDPRFIAISDYSLQLERWLRHFPAGCLHCIDFDAFRRSPLEESRAAAAFLGAPRDSVRPLDERSNSSEALRQPLSGLIRALAHSPLYRQSVKTLLPRGARDAVKRVVMRRRDERDISLSPEARAFAAEKLAGMPQRLHDLTGFRAGWFDAYAR